MAKYIPERTCACCRKTFPKNELIRVVKSGDDFFVDKTHKASGRGAYVCKNPDCLKNLIKSRALNRSFKTVVPEEVYQAVLKEAADGENANE